MYNNKASTHRRLAVLALALCYATACQTVQVTTDLDGAHLTVAGEDLGVVPEEGIEVDVGMGYSDVPYTLETDDGRVLQGSIARDDVSWIAAAGALSAGAVLVPVLATAAFLFANPSAIIGTFAAFNPYHALSQMTAPSALTVPLVGAAIVVGALPALVLLMFQAVPAAVVLTTPKPSARLVSADAEVQE
jgi:hypothetical protein